MRRASYLYDGFHDPWWKITGDSYRAMIACASVSEETLERLPQSERIRAAERRWRAKVAQRKEGVAA